MKSFALTSVVLGLACASAFAQRNYTKAYINGQAARMIIGQATFTDQYPGTSNKVLGSAGGVAYGRDTLMIADSSRFTGLTPQNRRVVLYHNVSSKLPGATSSISPYKSRCPICTGREDFPYPFDAVVGQPNFTTSEPAVTQTGLRLPTGVATDGTMMAVADTENNRILIWKTIPSGMSQPADIVLGQENFSTVRQPIVVDAKSFRGPQGVWIQNGKFFVADTQNHRVLIWNSIPSQNNQPADIVLGQANFTQAPEPDLTKLETAAHSSTLLNPVSVTSDGRHLFVADLGFHRVLIWNSIPTQNQQAADVVVGQLDMDHGGSNTITTDQTDTSTICGATSTDSAGNAVYPARCERTLSYPRFALSDGTRLYISDAGNDRILIFNTIPTGNAASADVVLGQPDFVSDNLTSTNDTFSPNFVTSAADTIPAPGGLAWDGENLYVADPTDRRILVFSPQSPDIARDGVRNAASLNIFALNVVNVTAAPKENDAVTITIAYATDSYTKDYKYVASKDDKIEQVIDGLVAAINADTGDPYVLARGNSAFNSLTLVSRIAGSDGFNIKVTANTSTSSQLKVSVQSANASTQTAQRQAPGTLVTIFGDNLATSTVSTPSDAKELPLELGGVEMYFDGIRSPLAYVSPTQVTAQLPYEVLDTTSVSSWMRIKQADGTYRTTTATPVPVTQQNPGIFADAGDEPRAVRAFHTSSSGTVTISVDGSINPSDVATITIEGRPYAYTIQVGDTLATVRDALVNLINANPDEKVVASAAGAFTRVVLKSKIPGDAGNGIQVTTTVSSGANILLTASGGATCCALAAGLPVDADNPAMPGEMITIYATGLGIVGPDAAKNALQTGVAYTGVQSNNPISSVSSLAGGKTANVISAGLAQGSIGIYEVVLELNSSLPSNPLTQLTIAQDIYTSNIVTIPVAAATPPAN